jgi:hypothetical protein
LLNHNVLLTPRIQFWVTVKQILTDGWFDMKKAIFYCLVGLFFLSSFSRVWAWGGIYTLNAEGKLQFSTSGDGPTGLVDLMNSGGCFYGHWVNANEEFFYQGDSALLNKFMERYSKLKNTPLTLIIHAGSHRRSVLWGEKPEKSYDWKLLIQKYGWGAPETASTDADDKYVVTVDAWIDRGIRLADLDIPANVAVKSGGEIEDFISKYKTKQPMASEDKNKNP